MYSGKTMQYLQLNNGAILAMWLIITNNHEEMKERLFKILGNNINISYCRPSAHHILCLLKINPKFSVSTVHFGHLVMQNKKL